MQLRLASDALAHLDVVDIFVVIIAVAARLLFEHRAAAARDAERIEPEQAAHLFFELAEHGHLEADVDDVIDVEIRLAVPVRAL